MGWGFAFLRPAEARSSPGGRNRTPWLHLPGLVQLDGSAGNYWTQRGPGVEKPPPRSTTTPTGGSPPRRHRLLEPAGSTSPPLSVRTLSLEEHTPEVPPAPLRARSVLRWPRTPEGLGTLPGLWVASGRGLGVRRLPQAGRSPLPVGWAAPGELLPRSPPAFRSASCLAPAPPRGSGLGRPPAPPPRLGTLPASFTELPRQRTPEELGPLRGGTGRFCG
jgi:hypothetical protein